MHSDRFDFVTFSCRRSRLALVQQRPHCGNREFQSTCTWLAKHFNIEAAVNLHHDFPCVNGQISIVERPIELLFSDWLIGRIVVRRKVWVSECLLRSYTLLRVKDEHVL